MINVGNIRDEVSFVGRNRVAFKEAHARLCAAIGFTHAVTLAFHRNARLEASQEALRRLHRRVEENLFGRFYYKLPSDQRTLAMFVFEGIPYNVHVHSLWRLPAGTPGANRLLRFHQMFPGERGGLWSQIVPSGTYKLRMVTDHADASNYVLKEQHMDSDDRTVIWSTDFARARQVGANAG